jgi:hypothetical protein
LTGMSNCIAKITFNNSSITASLVIDSFPKTDHLKTRFVFALLAGTAESWLMVVECR